MKSIATFAVTLLMAGSLSTVGCSSKSAEPAAAPAHDEHSHAEAGPHGGELIVLGNEEYHAEVLHENEAVVYLLDGSAKAAAAIDAAEVVLNVSHDGESEQFQLAARPEASDPAGKASRFASNDAELVADLQEGHAEVQLVLTIGGTQYRGALEHSHEHEGHAH
jgi:hypothetical protein